MAALDVRDELIGLFPEEFAACRALLEFVRSHPPVGTSIGGNAARIVLWTYARSAKTYRASCILAGAGFGEQACMLNRSLFEDMLIAHWVKLNPGTAFDRLRDHERLTRARGRDALERVGRTVRLPDSEKLTKRDRHDLQARFPTGKTWTGRSMPELLSDVRNEWPSPLDRKILREMVTVVNRTNNALLHHGSFALARAAVVEGESITFLVGPSDSWVRAALGGAFFTFGNTASLAYAGSDNDDALSELYGRHVSAFLETRQTS